MEVGFRVEKKTCDSILCNTIKTGYSLPVRAFSMSMVPHTLSSVAPNGRSTMFMGTLVVSRGEQYAGDRRNHTFRAKYTVDVSEIKAQESF